MYMYIQNCVLVHNFVYIYILIVVGGYVGGCEQGVIAIMRREVEMEYSDACVHTIQLFTLTIGDCTGITESVGT